MRYHPPPAPHLRRRRAPLKAGEVGNDDGAKRLGGIVGPDEVGAGLREVAERADAATAHRIQAEKWCGRVRAATAAVERGREDGKVAARGAVAAVEGGAGVEGDAALRVRAGWWRWAATRGLK